MAHLDQLKILVNLARIDGEVAPVEKTYITNIGKANGFPESSVATLFYHSHDTLFLDQLTPPQKFNYLFSLVQLMKIDGRVYESEIKYCADIASRLGYSAEAMFELMQKVNTLSLEKNELAAMENLVNSYLKINKP